jgi:uncharacterized protein
MCDHYIDADHFLGNLRERPLSELVADPAMKRFGQAKRDALPRVCWDCDVLASCNGTARRTGLPLPRTVKPA